MRSGLASCRPQVRKLPDRGLQDNASVHQRRGRVRGFALLEGGRRQRARQLLQARQSGRRRHRASPDRDVVQRRQDPPPQPFPHQLVLVGVRHPMHEEALEGVLLRIRREGFPVRILAERMVQQEAVNIRAFHAQGPQHPQHLLHARRRDRDGDGEDRGDSRLRHRQEAPLLVHLGSGQLLRLQEVHQEPHHPGRPREARQLLRPVRSGLLQGAQAVLHVEGVREQGRRELRRRVRDADEQQRPTDAGGHRDRRGRQRVREALGTGNLGHGQEGGGRHQALSQPRPEA